MCGTSSDQVACRIPKRTFGCGTRRKSGCCRSAHAATPASRILIVTRRLLALFAAATAAVSGCTVPTVGLTGIGIDQSGRPVGYVAVCDNHIDGATLYFEDEATSSGEDGTIVAGGWTADEPVTSVAAWSLSQPVTGWTATDEYSDLLPNRDYTLYGWTHDNSSSTSSVTFSLVDLAGLTPGQVRYWSGYDENSELDLYSTGSVDEFQGFACSQ